MPRKKSKFEQPLNILIVEDSKLDSKILESMLKEDADSTSTLKSTISLQGAMKLLQKNEFDVIILDLNLPDSEGEETLKHLNEQYPELAIVVNTGSYQDDVGLHTLSIGAQEFLIKGKYTTYGLNKALHYAIERKRLENELKRAYTSLQETQSQLIQSEKLKVVGGLATGVAHEVKNPLATILYGVTYLSDHVKVNDDKYNKVVKTVKEATHRANDIITDLLDFSSLTQLRLKDENLNGVIDKAVGLLNHELDKKHVKVSKQFSNNLPKVSIDRNRIEQVLINLILNSVHAMDQGGKICLKTSNNKFSKNFTCYPQLKNDGFKPGQRIVVVRIEDQGKGIPKDKLANIFDPFFTTRRGAGGIGLGLSVCRNIMDVHSGEIFIENGKTRGACATLIFKA